MNLSPGPRRIYPCTRPDDIWASPSIAGLPHAIGLVSGFCSSGPSFASGFLQIPPRGGHPCLRLVVPVITAHRGLTPPRFTPCLAHQKEKRRRGSLRFTLPLQDECLPESESGMLSLVPIPQVPPSPQSCGGVRAPLPSEARRLSSFVGSSTQPCRLLSGTTCSVLHLPSMSGPGG